MRKEKKSETLEIRLSHREKTDFASRAAERGESMSAAMRRMIAEDGVPCSKPKEVSMLKKACLVLVPFAVVASLVTAVTYSFSGAQARTDFKGNFSAKDANGDGFVDRDELIAVMQKRSEQVDLPPACDGTELARRWTFPPEALADGEIEFADGNGDGRLTLREVVAAFERQRADEFVQADADSNGYMTREELETAMRADEVNVSEKCRKAIGMHGAYKAAEHIAFMDRDGDELVSLREFVNH
ncbi:MAG: EF-hand domain-containing protein [Pseudomonadota bacterium]